MNIDTTILKAVLAVLVNCDGHAIGAETLAIETNALLDGDRAATRAETLAAVRHAQNKGWADFQASRIDRSEQWYITPEGRIVFREEFA